MVSIGNLTVGLPAAVFKLELLCEVVGVVFGADLLERLVEHPVEVPSFHGARVKVGIHHLVEVSTEMLPRTLR